MCFGSCTSRFISAPIGPSFSTASAVSASLKRENCAPPIFREHGGLRPVGERRVNADEIVGLGPLASAASSPGSGSGSVRAFLIFCAISSAPSVRLMRE